jgi:hypothetical protein
MSRDEGLAVALFAVMIGGAIALGIANDITAPACKAAKAQIGGAKDFDFGCLEFWLNRYQTTFAALVGAAVALYVVRPVFQQLREMTRQSAVAMRSAYQDRLARVEAEAEQYMSIARKVHETEKLLSRNSAWAMVSMQEIDAAIARLDELKTLAERASLTQFITESAQVRPPENLYAMLFNYINTARKMMSAGRVGERTTWRSCFPIVDGEIADLRGIFHGLAVALQPQIRKARADLAEVEGKMQ